jgi:hypothetical protein
MAHLYIGWDLITGLSVTDVAVDVRPSKQMTVYRTVTVLKLMNIFYIKLSSYLRVYVCLPTAGI